MGKRGWKEERAWLLEFPWEFVGAQRFFPLLARAFGPCETAAGATFDELSDVSDVLSRRGRVSWVVHPHFADPKVDPLNARAWSRMLDHLHSRAVVLACTALVARAQQHSDPNALQTSMRLLHVHAAYAIKYRKPDKQGDPPLLDLAEESLGGGASRRMRDVEHDLRDRFPAVKTLLVRRLGSEEVRVRNDAALTLALLAPHAKRDAIADVLFALVDNARTSSRGALIYALGVMGQDVSRYVDHPNDDTRLFASLFARSPKATGVLVRATRDLEATRACLGPHSPRLVGRCVVCLVISALAENAPQALEAFAWRVAKEGAELCPFCIDELERAHQRGDVLSLHVVDALALGPLGIELGGEPALVSCDLPTVPAVAMNTSSSGGSGGERLTSARDFVLDFPWEVVDGPVLPLYRLSSNASAWRALAVAELNHWCDGARNDGTGGSTPEETREARPWLPVFCACAEILRGVDVSDSFSSPLLALLVKLARAVSDEGANECLDVLSEWQASNEDRERANELVELVHHEGQTGFANIISTVVPHLLSDHTQAAMGATMLISLLGNAATHPELVVILRRLAGKGSGGVRAAHVLTLASLGADVVGFLLADAQCARVAAATVGGSPRGRDVLIDALEDPDGLASWYDELPPPHFRGVSPLQYVFNALLRTGHELLFYKAAVGHISRSFWFSETIRQFLQVQSCSHPGSEAIMDAFLSNRQMRWSRTIARGDESEPLEVLRWYSLWQRWEQLSTF